jgi:hypothetical protein
MVAVLLSGEAMRLAGIIKHRLTGRSYRGRLKNRKNGHKKFRHGVSRAGVGLGIKR